MELRSIVLIGFVAVLVILFLALATQGTFAMTQLAQTILIAVFIFAALILIGWGIYEWRFRKVSPKISKMVFEDIQRSAHISKSPYVRDLWLRGDAEHQGVELGVITGHTTFERMVELGKDWLELPKEEIEKTKKHKIKNQLVKKLQIEETYFAFKQRSLLMFLYPEEIVVAIANAWEIVEDKNGKEIGRKPRPELKQHSALNGDVELFGCAINRVGRFFYLPSYESSLIVDQIQTVSGGRKLAHYVLDEMAGAVDRAMDSNVARNIALEQQKLIPVNKITEEK